MTLDTIYCYFVVTKSNDYQQFRSSDKFHCFMTKHPFKKSIIASDI